MADVKISQLPASTTPLDGTEVLPIVQSATTKQVSVANLTAGRAVSALSLSLTNALPVTSGGTGIATTAAGTLLSSTALNTISATATPTLGVAGTTAGTLGLSGSSSGVVTLATASGAAGTWTMRLPTSGGTNGYILTTDGSGVTQWTNPTALGVDLDVGTTAITGGTTGRVLYDNAGVLGEYSSVPVSFGGTGLTSLTAGYIPYGNGTGAFSSSSALFFNGTNLGVGTSSPTDTGGYGRAVDIVGTNGSAVYIGQASGTGARGFFGAYNNGTDKYLTFGTLSGGGYLSILTDGTEKARIDASGNLLVGTTSNTSTVGTAIRNGYDAAAAIFIGKNNAPANSNWIELAGGGASRMALGWDTTSGGGYIDSVASYPILFRTNGTERMRLDASGNLGLGVTPSAWDSAIKAFQMNNQGALWSISSSNPNVWLSANTRLVGSTYYYMNAGVATYYGQSSGQHQWFTAASGSAGSAISFTQAMTLDASGNLGVGLTSPGSRLHVYGTNTTTWNTNDNGLYGYTPYPNELAIQNGSSGSSYFASLYFQVQNSTNRTARIAAIADGSSYGAILAFSNRDGSSANMMERMRIDSSGNVGIGTSSPTTYQGMVAIYTNTGTAETVPLSLINSNGAANTAVSLGFAPNTNIDLARITAIRVTAGGNTDLVFKTYNGSLNERARIDASGNLLVNKTSMSQIGGSDCKFQVSNGTNANCVTSYQTYAGGFGFASYAVSNGGIYYHMYFSDAGTSHGSITSDGTNTAYNTTSDISLKKNIQPASDALQSILSLKVRQFDWAENDVHTDYGVVAQEADEFAPEIVTKLDLWQVDYGRITPRLIKAFQELAAEVAMLKGQING